MLAMTVSISVYFKVWREVVTECGSSRKRNSAGMPSYDYFSGRLATPSAPRVKWGQMEPKMSRGQFKRMN